MSTDPLDLLWQLIAAGDPEGARRELVRVLRSNPRNVAAWELLATLLDDPAKQADCYRHVLSIDPQHSRAAASLAALTRQAPAPSSEQTASAISASALQCEKCGAAMETRFVGEMHDKRAVCPFCGHEVDLPDTFRRVETRREHEQRPGSSRTVDTVRVETRADFGAGWQPAHPDSELGDAPKLIQEEGPAVLDGETFQGVTYITYGQTPIDLDSAAPGPRDLSPEEIVRLAGDALPPEDRLKCPKCEAVVSRSATKCDWCGASLSEMRDDPCSKDID